MAEVDKIKLKIFNLLNKTISQGCSEAEALAAAELAGKLMDQYSLQMTDIQIRDEKCVQDAVVSPSQNRDGIDNCMVALGRYCDLKIWFSRGIINKEFDGYTRGGNPRYKQVVKREPRYCVFGLEQDVALFKYLYAIILASLDNAANDFRFADEYLNADGRGGRISAYKSFRNGFASGVSWKLHDMKKAREQEVREMRRTGTDLVIVKMATIEEEFKTTGIHLSRHNSYRNGGGDWNAQSAGRRAGKKISLNCGVGAGTGQAMIA